ncbi:uncharacterized protein LOC112511044 isoform X2 [Cynara cardunculus var. scolymus]|uniref:uncharacterized protein LOC112511044 isoform X2 n=1 Tax=Cynara cardunculus var. scolymus TaxID=59895 RepID=UPI000D62DC68|nr:uncharacterized protein LOC112511044 isoform X2 [Cynara cardunculus var. scolymus]
MDSDVTMVPAGEGSTLPGPSSSSSSKKPKRFEIKKWNAVALWAWVVQILWLIIAPFAGITSWISVSSAKLIRLAPPVRSVPSLGVCATMLFTFTASVGG